MIWILSLALAGLICEILWTIAYYRGYFDALKRVNVELAIFLDGLPEAESRLGEQAAKGVQAGVQANGGHEDAAAEACAQLGDGDGTREDARTDR